MKRAPGADSARSSSSGAGKANPSGEIFAKLPSGKAAQVAFAPSGRLWRKAQRPGPQRDDLSCCSKRAQASNRAGSAKRHPKASSRPGEAKIASKRALAPQEARNWAAMDGISGFICQFYRKRAGGAGGGRQIFTGRLGRVPGRGPGMHSQGRRARLRREASRRETIPFRSPGGSGARRGAGGRAAASRAPRARRQGTLGFRRRGKSGNSIGRWR